jgi:methyl coenzyme M reductase gamma subunit
MAARTIIEAERHANLEAFEETFAKLEGVTDEHVTALRRASTMRPGSPYPQSDDPLGQAAYTAAALRGLAEAVAVLQGKAAEPTKARKAS